MMKRKVAVVTTSRADYSHLYWPLKRLQTADCINLELIVLASHLSPEFGLTVGEIEADGFKVAVQLECLLSSDTDVGMAKSIGVAVLSLADTLGVMRPDILLLIADRYEILAPAAVALALRIPIVHIEGGEISEGAVDDAVRNALTKMAHIHFTSTETARQRVIAMGEETWRVHQVGAPSLDHLRYSRLPDRRELAAALGVSFDTTTAVVSYHPVTLLQDTNAEVDALFTALAAFPGKRLFCFPNADAGSRELIERTRAFVAGRAGDRLFINLPAIQYWALLREANLFIGNSSSGIMETASFELPTVNVGGRQQGRERAQNVLDAPAHADAILRVLQQALSISFRDSLTGMMNPYGDGDAAARIVEVLTSLPSRDTLLWKRARP